MSDSAPLGNLPIYNARTWTTGESMTRTKFQSEFDQAEALLTLCKTALADIQNRRHGSSSPTENAIAGQIWAKKISAARTQWFGDPDGAGADDQFLTEGEAYNADNKTAGTGTFKVGGAVNVDTTDVTQTGAGVLSSYTVPANTLNTDGEYFNAIGWGTRTSTGFIVTFQTRLNAGLGGGAHTIAVSNTNWLSRFIVVRTGANSQKLVSLHSQESDGTGNTNLLTVASDTEDMTANMTVDIYRDSTGTPNMTESAYLVLI